ncbi:MAG: hypothetical protein H0T62_07920 [Parachlamydiaceae bacterium]|nr:hypothetical protein [Parachlamydiaceae bacterium]
MKAKGIRILDKINRVVSVKLQDILKEISNGNLLYWSILHFYGSGVLKNEKSIEVLEEEANKSEKGFFLTWDDLNELANDLWEIEDMLVIGSKKQEKIIRHKIDQDMYESCDIVIEMFDSCYWEVFSSDEALINRLATKFKHTIFLKPNFEK